MAENKYIQTKPRQDRSDAGWEGGCLEELCAFPLYIRVDLTLADPVMSLKLYCLHITAGEAS